MKTISTQILIGSILLLSACGSSTDPLEVMLEKRDSLKKVVASVESEIAKLEEEIAKKDTSRKEKLKTVELMALTPQVFNNYIDIQGKVDADESIAINAEMPGTVTKVNVQLGDEVRKDQVLAELDSKVIQQGIAELQNALELANTMFEKQKNLWDQKIGTEMQYLGARNQKESLEKKMATLHEQLKMSKIISPINGIVDAIDIKLGQATMPGIPAMRVVNMNSLKVVGEVAESNLSKVKSGNEVIVIFPDMKDTVKTKITYAAKVISPLNRTFTTTVNLDGKKEYHPNMIAIMKIVDYSNPKAFVVPVSTIQKAQEGDFIFIAENKKAKKVKVKVGKTYNGNAEILEGLKEGDQLITKGFQELNEGETVNY